MFKCTYITKMYVFITQVRLTQHTIRKNTAYLRHMEMMMAKCVGRSRKTGAASIFCSCPSRFTLRDRRSSLLVRIEQTGNTKLKQGWMDVDGFEKEPAVTI